MDDNHQRHVSVRRQRRRERRAFVRREAFDQAGGKLRLGGWVMFRLL